MGSEMCIRDSNCPYIALHGCKITDYEIRLGREFNIKILAYGSNDRFLVEELKARGVSGFYIDSIL